MLVPATHNAPQYAELRDTYGRLDVDRDVPNDPMASGTDWTRATSRFSQNSSLRVQSLL